MRGYSLEELKETKNKLEKWIDEGKEFLGDYRDFFFKNGKYYFFITYYGIHKGADETELKDLIDIKTKKPLTELEKKHIENTCKKIVRLNKRWGEVNHKITTFYLGENFFESKNKSQFFYKSDYELFQKLQKENSGKVNDEIFKMMVNEKRSFSAIKKSVYYAMNKPRNTTLK